MKKIVVITGCSSGFGKLLALDLARRGDHVYPDTPTDPDMVVKEIIALIDTPAGSRPFRTVVGVDVGVRERNAAVEPVDAAVLEAFGMTKFAALVRTDE